MIERVLKGNDIYFRLIILGGDINNGKTEIYITDIKGKTKVDFVPEILYDENEHKISYATFQLKGITQSLGTLRIDVYQTVANYNRRYVANNVIEFVDNPESVTNQENIINECEVRFNGLKAEIQCT
jgi:hypothetical protein